MDKRKAYEDKLDAQLDVWTAQIRLLKARADKAKAGMKIETLKTIERLQARRDEAEMQLKELKAGGDEAWEDLKSGAEKAWGEIKTAFQKATSKLE